MKITTRLLFLAGFLFPLRAFAIFGIGDIVFDPANYAQIISVVNQLQNHGQILGQVLGVDTEQLNQLTTIRDVLGTAQRLQNFPRNPSPSDVLGLLRQTPGFENLGLGDLSKLFNSSGVLDVFMGQPASQWKETVSDPMAHFGNALYGDAVNRLGGDLGLTTAETQFVGWMARMDPGERTANRLNIAENAADLILNRWLQATEQRQKAKAELAARIGADNAAAGQAQSVNEQMAAQTRQLTTNNNILLNNANEVTKAHEVERVQAQSEIEVLKEQLLRDELRRKVDRLNQ